MYLIGLTGGIASGKSVVASRLAEHGAIVVDADKISREIVRSGEPTLDRIVNAFGNSILTESGELDRAALGKVIFEDPAKRLLLNSIMHPEVKSQAQRQISVALESDPNAVIVYDVPLLVEAGVDSDHPFDLIVVVDASEDVRLNRLVTLRGLSRHEAQARLQSQASETARLEIADVVIDSNGTLGETVEQVDALWDEILETKRAND